MLSVTPEFLAALSSSQQVSARADLLKGGVVIYSGLPVTGGSVSFSRSQVASRQLTCTLAPQLDLGDYKSESTLTGTKVGVYGHEVRIYWTLHFVGGGQESLPIARCRIDTMSGSLVGDGVVTISGSSREAFVADDSFIAPRTLSGPSAQSMIGTLIRESLGSAEIVVSASRDVAVPVTTFSSDRWEAIRILADSIAATVRCDAYGRFIVADAPTVNSPAVWSAKVGPGGVLTGVDGEFSRARVRNAWIVQGSAPGTASIPIQAVVYDNDPTSPTRYGDPDAGYFGRVPETVQISTLTTLDQCRSVALARLAQTCGAASSLNISTVPNPALDVSDVIDVYPSLSDLASRRRHMIDSGSFDLSPGGAFSLSTRDLRQVTDV